MIVASLFSLWTVSCVGVAQRPGLQLNDSLFVKVWAAVQMLPWPLRAPCSLDVRAACSEECFDLLC